MFLLDTNVVSEIRKIKGGKADPNVARWVEALDPGSAFVSVITLRELEIGVMRAERRDPTQGALLRLWLETMAIPAFGGRILPVDIVVAKRAAKLPIPNPHPINYAFIAATALVHGMTVVTRNISDFEATGARVFNPWDA